MIAGDALTGKYWSEVRANSLKVQLWLRQLIWLRCLDCRRSVNCTLTWQVLTLLKTITWTFLPSLTSRQLKLTTDLIARTNITTTPRISENPFISASVACPPSKNFGVALNLINLEFAQNLRASFPNLEGGCANRFLLWHNLQTKVSLKSTNLNLLMKLASVTVNGTLKLFSAMRLPPLTMIGRTICLNKNSRPSRVNCLRKYRSPLLLILTEQSVSLRIRMTLNCRRWKGKLLN